MDIRTKLVFTLVAVSLASMFAVGAVVYTTARQLLQESALRQLDGLAESKEEDLENVIAAWRDRVNLIASRTQLRLSLREYNETGDPEERRRIERILTDAASSVETVGRLTVYGPDGRRVATTPAPEDASGTELEPGALPPGASDPVYRGIEVRPDGDLTVDFVAPLLLDGEQVGALRAVMSADELIEITTTYRGLGATGETLIVLRDSAGVPQIVHPVRHSDERPDVRFETDSDDPVGRAIRGVEGVFSEGLTDYRGEPVWAATRYLPGVNWGLVVKFDAAEEQEPVLQLRNRLARLALSLSAYAILLGTLLGLWFARPIHDLAEAANRIRLGDMSARAPVAREDEVGALARTFNEMAEELERRMQGSGGPVAEPGGGDPSAPDDPVET